MSNLTKIVEVGEDDNDAQTNVTLQSFHTTSIASGPYQRHVVDDFLTDDEGNSLFRDASSTVTNSSTFSFGGMLSRLSLATTDSVAPHLAAGRGDRIMPLAELCDIIDGCKSLEAADILSVECYREWSSLGILHRTLIFELRRSGRDDVWLRIDRRRSRTVSLPAFIASRGKTEANDVAQLASRKSVLLRRHDARPESRIEFTSSPNLGIFSFYFRAICAEMLEYHIWPENCWFMCSLLQEHLTEEGSGTFVLGRNINIEPFSLIRSQIWLRRYHNLPIPVNVHHALTRISRAETPHDRELLRLWVRRYRLYPDDASQKFSPFDGMLSGCIYHEMPHVHEVLMILYAKHRARCRPHLSQDPLLQNFVDLDMAVIQEGIFAHVPLVISPVRAVEMLVSLEQSLCKGEYPTHAVGQYERLVSLREPRATLLRVSITRALHSVHPRVHRSMLASRLLRLARLMSVSDSAASRACIVEARAVLAQSDNVYSSWWIGGVLTGHTGTVSSVVISPDGELIASGSYDATIRFWDARTGDSIGEPLRGHTYDVRSVAFSPHGEQLNSGSENDTMRLGRWDVSLRKPVGEPLQHASAIVIIAFSPDGSLMASGSDDSTIQLWDASTSARLGEPLSGHTNWVTSLAFSQDGLRLVSGSGDKTIQLWDVATGRAIGAPMERHTETVRSVAFSPDGNLVVSGSWDHTLRRWDATTGEPVGEAMNGHTNNVNCVAFSPDGKTIVSGSGDRTIRLWDAMTGKAIGEPLEGHTDSIISVAFSPEGGQIVSGSDDGTVRIWDSLDLDRWRDAE